MSWSPQQEGAIKAVRAWLAAPRRPQIFRLFGYAGTGKTTLAMELSNAVGGRVLFGAFTGKASLVLRKKGCPASTLHSMIYKFDDAERDQPTFTLDPESSLHGASLLVVDEVSMVSEELGLDLLSFGVPILVLGDPAQLPPVSGTGFFTEAEPDVMLTEIHRQAAGNPIVDLATQVRQGERLRYGDYGTSRVISLDEVVAEEVLRADQVLVGRNRTRTAYNARIRELLDLPAGRPVAGDKLVCLRNDRELKILNGGLHLVKEVVREGATYTKLDVVPEERTNDDPTAVLVRNEFFLGNDEALTWREKRGSQEFTYGYALTVHKSQGSQWNDVFLVDESSVFREHRARWLYTGLTRAAERVTVVV